MQTYQNVGALTFKLIAVYLQGNKTIWVGSVKYAAAESYNVLVKVSAAILETYWLFEIWFMAIKRKVRRAQEGVWKSQHEPTYIPISQCYEAISRSDGL